MTMERDGQQESAVGSVAVAVDVDVDVAVDAATRSPTPGSP